MYTWVLDSEENLEEWGYDLIVLGIYSAHG